MAKEKITLSPDAFKVNENGEIVVNSQELADALSQDGTDKDVGEQGVRISVSFN